MLDPSTVSRHICSMADDGLVTRTPDEHDRRVQWVDISQSGREHLQAATRARVALFEQVLAEWPEHERIVLGELLEIIRRDGAKESGDSANHVAFHPSQGQIATLVQLPPNRGCQTWRCLSTPDQCRIGGCDWECIRDHGAVSN